MSDEEQTDIPNTEGVEAQPADNNAAEGEQQQAVAAGFDTLVEDGGSGALVIGTEKKLDIILDIPVMISVEIGRTTMNIRNILQLNQGSVVELDRLAGEALDVMVNGTLVAHGEVVVVNDKFGVRLTDVISTAERLQKIK